MTPEERYEALAEAEATALERLADEVLAAGARAEVVAGPEVVTAPIRVPVPGTRSTTGVVGHATLTMCTVELGGVRGDGCRRGHDLSGAVAAAVCDAEVERDGPRAGEVVELVRRSAGDRRARWAERAHQVELTRVGP
jgi:alpha-D-ribose 1-methylphosphonate 5-triphosphate synthase subunit PhnG